MHKIIVRLTLSIVAILLTGILLEIYIVGKVMNLNKRLYKTQLETKINLEEINSYKIDIPKKITKKDLLFNTNMFDINQFKRSVIINEKHLIDLYKEYEKIKILFRSFVYIQNFIYICCGLLSILLVVLIWIELFSSPEVNH